MYIEPSDAKPKQSQAETRPPGDPRAAIRGHRRVSERASGRAHYTTLRFATLHYTNLLPIIRNKPLKNDFVASV